MLASSNSGLKRWPVEGAYRVPNWVYSDPEIFALEQERIFEGRGWSYVCLESEIPNVGDFKRSQIGVKQVVAIRSGESEISVLLNRCAHRGSEFCSKNHGNAPELVCPYHQWTYDLKGALIGVPFRRGYKGQGGLPTDFKTEEHGLRRLNVVVRNGVVFASFREDTEDFAAYLGPRMLALYDRVFDGRKLEVCGYMRQRIPSNWKLMVENIKDPYHASLLHVFLVTFGLFRLDQKSTVEMDATGRHGALTSCKGPQETNEATRQMRAFKESLTLQDKRLLDPVREFPGDETVVMLTLWPNIIIQQQSNTLAMRQIVPVNADSFDLVWTFFGYADDTKEMRQRRVRQANLMGPAGYVSVDDSEAMMLSQRGIGMDPEGECLLEMGGREVKDETHMITEAALRGFYQHYRDVMGL